MSRSKISIIIPVYNVEKYLEKCLYRLSHQTLSNIEVVIINDGSTDNSQKIIDKFVELYPDIFKSYTKKNGGVSSARNLGLSKATGDFIAFVDSDDYIEFDMYSKMYEKAISDNCDIVSCGFNRWYLKNNRLEGSNAINLPFTYQKASLFGKSISEEKALMCYAKPYLWNKIYRRSLFEGVVFPEGQIYEDDAVIYGVMHKANHIGLVNEPLYNYIVKRPGSITGAFNKRVFDIFKSCDSIISYFQKSGNFENYYAEIEYVCIVHIFARFKGLSTKKDRKLVFMFIDESFNYLDSRFPKWRDNEYYLNSQIPKLVRHPLSSYVKVRDNHKKLKRYIKYRPLILRRKRAFNFYVSCTRGVNELLRQFSGANKSIRRRKKPILNDYQLSMLQAEVLSILKIVDEFCIKNNIVYYMSEGSLLGTVRHKGFIPWDDDIDIMMPRDDYKRFIELWGQTFNSEHILLHYSTYKKYYLPFAKVVFTGDTKFKSLTRIANEDIMGPSIDIFPIDSCLPITDSRLVKKCRKMRKLRNIVLTKVGYMRRSDTRARYALSARLFTEKWLLSRIDKLMEENNNHQTGFIANFASSYPISKECFKQECFKETIRVEFEDISVNIPSGYHEILTKIYGDYMVLPPESKRVHRHSYQWIGDTDYSVEQIMHKPELNDL